MENKKQKIILIILLIVFLLVIIASLFVKIMNKDTVSSSNLSSYTETLHKLKKEQRSLNSELEQVQNEYDITLKGEPNIVLSFKNPDKTLCSQISPFLKTHKAVFILSENKLPNDENMISNDDYKALIKSGWQTAIGDNFPQNEDEFNSWKDGLDKLIKRLKSKKIDVPTAYYLYEDYNSTTKNDVLNALKERGFTSVSWHNNSEESDDINCYKTVNMNENSLKLSEVFENVTYGKIYVVTFNSVKADITDKESEFSFDRLEELIDYIDKNISKTAIKTFDEAYTYKESLQNNEKLGVLSAKIDDLNDKIKKNQEEIDNTLYKK